MDLFEAVKNRYSYRGEFKDIEIPEEDLKKILQAGLDAPSGKNEQTTRFVIINDNEKLIKISGIIPNRPYLKTCKALILCIVDTDPEKIYHDFSFQIEDCSAAVENILLAITALGYASVWLDGVLRLHGVSDLIGEVISLPENKKIQIMLPVGIPVSDGPRKEKMSFNERVSFNIYGE